MKVCAKKDDFLKTLSHVQSVVERRNAIQVLSNVKIESRDNNKLVLNATDLDIAIFDECLATVEKEGATTISAITLFEIVRKIPNNCDIIIETIEDEELAIITTEFGDFKLPTIPVKEFPNFEIDQYTHKFSIHSEILKLILSKTRHAISTEETRYYLNGTYLHTTTTEDGAKVLRAVATDGHRLAMAQTILPEGAADMPEIIIPKKAVNEVIKLLEDFAGEVQVQLSSKKITFKIDNASLASKLIDGKFPDYERVIPKGNDKILEIERDKLIKSIDLVISISNDKTKAVQFAVEPTRVIITASSTINGNSSGTQEIPANYNSMEPITIGFNSRYVLDSLGTIDGNTVKVLLSSNVGAIIAQDANEDGCVHVLMPMKA